MQEAPTREGVPVLTAEQRTRAQAAVVAATVGVTSRADRRRIEQAARKAIRARAARRGR